MAGLPTTAGSLAIADRAEPATRDAACVAGLRAAQRLGTAWFAGKTNLHELAYGITGVNAWTGTPVNPLDPRRVPGGSSSGSATAVAAGEAPLTIGRLAIDADPAITEAIGIALRTAGFDLQPVTVPELDAVIAASL